MQYKFIISSSIFILWATFSIAGIRAELLPFFRDIRNDKSETGTVFDSFNLDYSYSSYSKFLVLNDCLIGMQILVTDPKSILKKHEFDTSCYKVSTQIIQKTPSYSFAWHINALSGILKGDTYTASASLNNAHLTAPNEGWLAQLRIAFFEKNAALLEPQSRDIYSADLKLLGHGTGGLAYLAARYMSEPAMQATIIDAIESLSPDRQKQFLALMRKQMNE